MGILLIMVLFSLGKMLKFTPVKDFTMMQQQLITANIEKRQQPLRQKDKEHEK